MSEETTQKPKSRKSKLIKWLILVLVIIIAAPIVLSLIVSSGIKVGGSTVITSLTKGEANIGGAYLNLLTGRLQLKDILIKNPLETADGQKTDFAHEEFFKLGELDVELSIPSLMSDEIIVKKVHINAPQITYEKSLFASSNLDVILKNVEAATGGPKDKPEEKKEEKDDASQKKVIIEDLVINGAQVNLASMGMTAPLPIPEIHMTDLGKPGQPLALADAIKETFTSLFTGIFDNAKQVGVSMLNGGKDAAKNALESGKEQGKALLENGKDTLKKLNPFAK